MHHDHHHGHHHAHHFSVFSGPSNPWEAAWASLTRAAFALDTVSDDEALQPIERAVSTALREWSELESRRVQLRTAALAVAARIRVADAALDHRIESIANVVIASHGGRDGEQYKKLFPAAHEGVVALGLDAEVPAATMILSELERTQNLPSDLAEELEPLRTALQVSNRALLERGDVYALLGSLQARVEAWLDSARVLHDHVAAELGILAKNRGLPSRWVEALSGG
jgi:hypothetical protein